MTCHFFRDFPTSWIYGGRHQDCDSLDIMSTRFILWLIYTFVPISLSQETRNILAETLSYQITTVYSNTTAIVDVFWNTKSLPQGGWSMKYGDSTCRFPSPLFQGPRSISANFSIDEPWSCRSTRTFFIVVQNNTLSRGHCGSTAVVTSLEDGCSGTGNNAAWSTWLVELEIVDTLTAYTNELTPCNTILKHKHAKLSL